MLLVDEYYRFPDVEVLSTPAASEVIPKLDRIFGTHGVQERTKSDIEPTFNDAEFKESRKRGFYHQLVNPGQPSSNGLAENFMRML